MIPIFVVRGEIEEEIKGLYKAEDEEEALEAMRILMEYENIKENESVWIEIGRDKEW